MLKVDDEVFLQLAPDSHERILHPGQVVTVMDTLLTVRLAHDVQGFGSDQDLVIYFYRPDEAFVKQSSRLNHEFRGEPDETRHGAIFLEVEMMGTPIPALDRRCFRVATVVEDMVTSFGAADNCAVLDLSPIGFAVVSPDEYGVGTIVEASLRYGEFRGKGLVRIQSAAALPGGYFRYGVQSVESDLEVTLQQISMAVQRQQLQRLSGRA